jgi:hypothetical protein
MILMLIETTQWHKESRKSMIWVSFPLLAHHLSGLTSGFLFAFKITQLKLGRLGLLSLCSLCLLFYLSLLINTTIANKKISRSHYSQVAQLPCNK